MKSLIVFLITLLLVFLAVVYKPVSGEGCPENRKNQEDLDARLFR